MPMQEGLRYVVDNRQPVPTDGTAEIGVEGQCLEPPINTICKSVWRNAQQSIA